MREWQRTGGDQREQAGRQPNARRERRRPRVKRDRLKMPRRAAPRTTEAHRPDGRERRLDPTRVVGRQLGVPVAEYRAVDARWRAAGLAGGSRPTSEERPQAASPSRGVVALDRLGRGERPHAPWLVTAHYTLIAPVDSRRPSHAWRAAMRRRRRRPRRGRPARALPLIGRCGASALGVRAKRTAGQAARRGRRTRRCARRTVRAGKLPPLVRPEMKLDQFFGGKINHPIFVVISRAR